MSHRVCHLALIFCLVVSVSSLAQGPNSLSKSQMPSVVVVPAEAQPSPNFNADTATNAYLAQIPAAARARSDAYFEGGYWMILWDFLYGFVVALLLLDLRGRRECVISLSASRASCQFTLSFTGSNILL